jgi:hypothetical protein
MQVYNTSPQEALGGMSPFEVLRGRPEPRYDVWAYPDTPYPPRYAEAIALEPSPREYGPKNKHPYLRSPDFGRHYFAVPEPAYQGSLEIRGSKRETFPTAHAYCRMMAKVGSSDARPQNSLNDEVATSRVFRSQANRWSLVPRSQWMLDCEPRLSDDEADRV